MSFDKADADMKKKSLWYRKKAIYCRIQMPHVAQTEENTSRPIIKDYHQSTYDSQK